MASSTARRAASRPSSTSQSTSQTSATFEASVASLNIDSPANNPPIRTPYRPPTEPIVEIGLDAVRPAQLVELVVGVDELRRDPAVRPTRIARTAPSRRGTGCRTRTSNRRQLRRSDRGHDQAVEGYARRAGRATTSRASCVRTGIGKSPRGRRRAACPGARSAPMPHEAVARRRAPAAGAANGWPAARSVVARVHGPV